MSLKRKLEPRRSPRILRSASTATADEARPNGITSEQLKFNVSPCAQPLKRVKPEPRRSTPRKGALGSKVMGYLEAPKIGQRILVLSQYSTQEVPATVTKVGNAAVKVSGEVGGWHETIPHAQWFERTTPIEVVTGGSSTTDGHLLQPTDMKPRSRKSRTQFLVAASADTASTATSSRLTNVAAETKPVHEVGPIPALPVSFNGTSRPHLAVLLALTLSWCAYKLQYTSLGFEDATLALVGTSPVLPTAVLLAFRAAATVLVLSVLFSTLSDSTYLNVETQYMAGSVLQSKLIRLRGVHRLSTFTVWCWCLVGVYFTSATVATVAAYIHDYGGDALRNTESDSAWAAWALKVLYRMILSRSFLNYIYCSTEN